MIINLEKNTPLPFSNTCMCTSWWNHFDESMLMIPLVFYRYILWFVVFGGCLGHLISLFVFTRTCFRSHSTSLHFLALTLADGIFVGIFIPLRILRDGFDIDAISLSLVFCKLSFFIEDCIRFEQRKCSILDLSLFLFN